MIIEFVSCFIFLLASIFATYFIGSVVYNSFIYLDKDKDETGFFELAIGLASIVILLPIFFTRFKTVFLLAFIPIGLIYWLNRTDIQWVNPFKKINYSESGKNILRLFIVSIPIYIIASVTFFSFNDFPYQLQHGDFFVYAEAGKAMLATGNENYFSWANFMFPDYFKGMSPYHYFEIWLNVFIGTAFKLSLIQSFMLITFPLMQLTCIVGLIALLKSVINKKVSFFLLALIGFILVYIQPLFFSFYTEYDLLKYHIGICNTSVLSFGRKYAPIFIYSVLFLLMYIKNKQREAFILLSSLPILSIGLLPSLGLGLFSYFGWNFLRNKKKLMIYHMVYLVLFSLILLSFYRFNAIDSIKDLVENDNFIGLLLKKGPDTTLIKTFIFKAIFPFIRVLLFTFPYFLIIFFFSKRSEVSLLNSDGLLVLLILLIIISGTLGAALAYDLPDAGQLLYNSLPLLNVFIAYFILRSSVNIKWITFLLIMLPISGYNAYNSFKIIQSMNNYSDTNGAYNLSHDFLLKCVNHIEEDSKKHPIIGYLYKDKEEISPNGEMYLSPAIFLAYSQVNPVLVCLNDPRKIVDGDESHVYKPFWPFYIFSEMNKSLNYTDLLGQFVDKHKVTYLFIHGKEVPSVIENSVSLLFYDKQSDFNFYEIKPLTE